MIAAALSRARRAVVLTGADADDVVPGWVA